MRTIVVALPLAIAAIACEGRPARDPSQTTTTSARSEGDHDANPQTIYTTRPERRGTQHPSGARANAESAGEAASGAPLIEQQSPDAPAGAWRGEAGEEEDAVTVGDQGNSEEETRITADIRKQLVVSKTLSLSAKNAKVITTGSKVTLRGTVKSEKERAEIEGIAKGIDGVNAVDNEIEVKP